MRPPDPAPVLVVEDNPDDVLLIRRAFAKVQLLNPLHFVDNGDAALDYLAGRPPYADRARYPIPGLVLLDLKLPRRSGIEVLHSIRQNPHFKVLPVVVLTSSKEGGDVQRAYAAGANSYLMKPVAFDDLMEMIRTVGQYWFALAERPQVSPG